MGQKDELQALIADRRSYGLSDYNGDKVPEAVIQKMFEAANWAPTHGQTEPWRFVVFRQEHMERINALKLASLEEKFMDDAKKLDGIRKKIARKSKQAKNLSHVIAICLKRVHAKGKSKFMPEWEDIAAVATAVQNMHLVLTAHPPCVGYWSSGGSYG